MSKESWTINKSNKTIIKTMLRKSCESYWIKKEFIERISTLLKIMSLDICLIDPLVRLQYKD